MNDQDDALALKIWDDMEEGAGLPEFARRLRAARSQEAQPVAWMEIAVDGRILGASLIRDSTSPFRWKPLYTLSDPAPPSGVEEGCTPADAKVLREANHTIAQESHRRAELLHEWLDTELDSQDEEYQPWINSFTERVQKELAPTTAAPSGGQPPLETTKGESNV